MRATPPLAAPYLEIRPLTIGRSKDDADAPGDRHDTLHDVSSLPPARGRSLVDNGLAERLEGYIERRACGRIRDLHVVCQDDTIILSGRARTYHAKQLAQEAVLDLTEGFTALANQIVVY